MLYDFECAECHLIFERYVKSKDESPSCPFCGASGSRRRFVQQSRVSTGVGSEDPWDWSQSGRGKGRTVGDMWQEAAEKSERRKRDRGDGRDPVLERKLAQGKKLRGGKTTRLKQEGTGERLVG